MVKKPLANAGDRGDAGSIPGWRRSPGKGNFNPLQYPCLKNHMDRGAWQASLWDRKESDTTEQASAHTHHQHLFVLSLQLCPTLCDPKDYSPPGSPVHGIFQARILEWIAMPSSRGSSRPRDGTCVSYVPAVAGGLFTTIILESISIYHLILSKCFLKCFKIAFLFCFCPVLHTCDSSALTSPPPNIYALCSWLLKLLKTLCIENFNWATAYFSTNSF